jgi:hypothetical protein
MAVKICSWFKRRLKDEFSNAVDPDNIAQSEFFKLREEGYNPITVNEARERRRQSGDKANAYKMKIDDEYMFVEEIPICP